MKIIARMLRRLKSQKWMAGFTILLTAVQCVMVLYIPLLMAEIVNNGIMLGDYSVIASQGLKMLILCVAMSGIGYACGISCACVSQRFEYDLRTELYQKAVRLSLRQAEDITAGSFVTRITLDVSRCAAFVNVFCVLLLEPVLMVIGGIRMMWSLAPGFGMVFIAFAAVQVGIMMLFIRKTAPMFMKVQKITDRLNAKMQTIFANIRLVKGYTSEDYEKKRFGLENEKLFETGYQVQKLLAVFNPIVLLIMNLSIACILLLAGFQVSNGSIRLGNIMAAITYSEQILLTIIVSGQMFRMLTEAEPSAERIFEILDQNEEMPETGIPITGKIHSLVCRDVSFSYPGSGPILEHLNFQIMQGEFVAVTGTIGGGKSTLMSILARLYDVTGGAVCLDGRDIREFVPGDVRKHIAIAERQAFLFEGTLEDNILMGRDYITPEDAEKAAAAARLEDLIRKLPEGKKTELTSRGTNLSGGEKQRLVIARALAGSPDFLILDDCTSAIDYKTEYELLGAIRKTYPETAILLVTHRLNSAKMADRIAVLSGKQFAAIGTDAELRKSCGVYRELCRTQESSEAAADE